MSERAVHILVADMLEAVERIIRSRHIVVHDYFGTDYGIVWRIVQVHLPPLKTALAMLQTKLPPAS